MLVGLSAKISVAKRYKKPRESAKMIIPVTEEDNLIAEADNSSSCFSCGLPSWSDFFNCMAETHERSALSSFQIVNLYISDFYRLEVLITKTE